MDSAEVPPTMRAAFGDDGYIVREGLLGAAEINELTTAVEAVATAVVTRAQRDGAGPTATLADGHRLQLSSRTAIQWEWSNGSQAIRLLEPCDHLHPAFAELFSDSRLAGPAREELSGPVDPFTSKMNLKRAQEGSEFPWHQDYPYWYVAAGEAAQDVVTAIVFLDDATSDNGALRVLPGSHRNGPVRRDPNDPTRFLTDAAAIDLDREIVLERLGSRRAAWFESYLERIIDRDAPEVAGLQRLRDLPTLLRFIAAKNAAELNVSSLANDAGFASRTIGPYLDLLETLYLVYRMPAWSANIGRRLVRRPRIAMVDSGLASHLTNTSPANLATNPNPVVFGGLVEGFAVAELRKLASTSDAQPKLHYLREHGGIEIDILLERRDGGVVAIEIKASSSPRASDTRWLAQFRDQMGERFIQGIVLHLGSDIVTFGDRIRALPLSALWT